MSRKRVRRWQRKLDGGTVYVTLHDDGQVRIRTDHPSNDPATEIAMAATVIRAFTSTYAEHGVKPKLNALTWRSDP